MTAPFPPVDGTQPCAEQDPDIFFPEVAGPGQKHAIAQARAVCAPCPFRQACLDYALDYLVDGVWGATTARDRKQIRHDRGMTGESITGLHDRYELADRRAAATTEWGSRRRDPVRPRSAPAPRPIEQLRPATPPPPVTRSPARPPTPLARHIAARRAAGETAREIAADRGVSEQAIHQHIRIVKQWASTH